MIGFNCQRTLAEQEPVTGVAFVKSNGKSRFKIIIGLELSRKETNNG